MTGKITGQQEILNLNDHHIKSSLLIARELVRKKVSYLNRINYYPIPDKDTGTNLFHTLNAVCSEIQDISDCRIGQIGKKIISATASGAQGFSGIILAYFFQGFFQTLTEKKTLTTMEFARATDLGCKSALQAISNPESGTIISVMQDWSTSVSEISAQTENFKDLLIRSFPEAKKSLAQTKKILPVLKKAGVVDAGAQGFIYLIEGMVTFLKKGLSKNQFTAGSARIGVKKEETARIEPKYGTSALEKTIGIVTDSSCDLPADFSRDHHIHIIPLKIIFGDQILLDKIQISPSEFYNRLVESSQHPQTSQPNLSDVTGIFNKVVPRYDHILSIHLPRAVSGTLSVIEKAAEKYRGKITCFDGKSISAGLGLVVMEAASALDKGHSLEEIKDQIQRSIDNIKIFIVVPTVKYLVRGGRLSKSKGIVGRVLRLNPIISFDDEGRLIPLANALGNRAALKKSFKIAREALQTYERIKIMVAHANAPAKARWVSDQLSILFRPKDEIQIVDAAPALGVHAGPGTVGFGFIGYHEK